MPVNLDQRLVLARVLVLLVGVAGLVTIGFLDWAWFDNIAKYYWLLHGYFLLLLAPWLHCCWQRGRWAWKNGFQRLPRGLGRRLYGGTLLVFLSLTVLLYSVELWRGKRAYAQLKRDVESQGGSLELATVIPAPVAEDQNFCATPLLSALTDYIAPPNPFISGPVQWGQPDLMARWQTMCLPRLKDTHKLVSWPHARQIDLRLWQRCLTGHTNFSLSVASTNSAKDILTALGKFEPELAELHAARTRPQARWAIHYQDGWFGHRGERNQHLWNLSEILNLRAVASLFAGNPDAALQEVMLMWRLADSVKQEPSVYAHHSRLGWLMASLQPVWEGLVTHRWADGQLIALESRLRQFDLSADWKTAARGETYLQMELCQQVNDLWSWRSIFKWAREMDDSILAAVLYRLFYPTGWLYQDLVYLYRFSEERLSQASLADLGSHVPAKQIYQVKFPVDPFLAIFILPRMQEIFHDQDFIETQVALDEARVACALERYWLAQGEYPTTLENLIPRFIDELPWVANRQHPKLAYRRLADDRFLLHPATMENVTEYWPDDPYPHQAYGRIEVGDGVWRFPR